VAAFREAPFGTWSSPISAAAAGAGAIGLSQPQLDGGFVYWLEARPAEAGRQTVMRAPLAGGSAEEMTPGRNVRSRVHEYGGGDYRVRGGVIVAADATGGALLAGRMRGALPSARSTARYGDFAFAPDGGVVVAVEEEHGAGEPANRMVALALDGPARTVVTEAHDFVASPAFSRGGDRLAFVTWEHPDMPWDATTLQVVAFGDGALGGTPRAVAGGGDEAIVQPRFAPGGALTFVSDRTGWWNLYQERGDRQHALCPREAEFGLPMWVLGLASYAFESDAVAWCTLRSGGRDALARLDVEKGTLESVPLPFDGIGGLTIEGGHAAFIGSGGARTPTVCVLDLATRALREVRRASQVELEPAFLSLPEPVGFASEEGRTAHAFLYRPASGTHRGPAGARPPLVVRSHGGPTSCAIPALRLGLQYWTSRGFAVIDVDYAGSTGYGRAYRNLLRGEWGVRDVADCAAAARFAAGEGAADPAQLLATGGSAGGYTTLCLLTFRSEFAAGASHYGVGDLEALARDTHKFESRYLDRLIGPYPERADLYRARSPLTHADRLARPVIFFQGLDDRVVPPNQTESMVEALARRGIPHAYVAFEGEGHGFRRAENIQTALEGERWFYANLLGLEATPAPAGVVLRNAPGGRG
jgi:dipeptidyl aminopeptidase/acylaminoacyl peptidase